MSIREIVLVHHTHTDIGYTGHPAAVASQHVRHFREALRLCALDARFRWTIESSWSLQQFLAVAGEEELRQLRAGFARGAIELTGFYTQPLTQLGDLDVLIGSVEPTMEMAGQFGVKPRVAILDDIGGASYNLPQVLRNFNIEHVVNGCGGWRVMLPFTTLPHVFFLQGPDGSRVTYYHLGDRHDTPASVPAQYGYGIIYFLWPMLRQIDGAPTRPQDDGERGLMDLCGRQGIDSLLARLESEGYAYDTLLLQTGMDNGLPEPRLLEAIDHWNRVHQHPRIRLGTAAEFFDDQVSRHAGKIPAFDGELTCSWTEHAITHAAATSLFRRTSAKLRAFAALEAHRIPRPRAAEIDTWKRVMRQLVLYADHTFGISMWFWEQKVNQRGSLWDETFDLPRRCWDAKARYARHAADLLEDALDRQRLELTCENPDAPSTITIFNPHGFTYAGTGRFESAHAQVAMQINGQAMDVDTRAINSKWFSHKFRVTDLPALSATVCDVKPAAHSCEARFAAEDHGLRGGGWVADISAVDGSVTLWRDARRIGAGLNDLHYFNVRGVLETVGKCGLDETVRFDRVALSSVEFLASDAGACGASMLLRRTLQSADGPMQVETQYILDDAGLHARNRARKIHSHRNEACFFAFPFEMRGPFEFHVAQQGQVTRFPAQRLPGSSNHNFGMQDFIAVSDAGHTAMLVSDDAPLVALGKPSYYHFGLDYPVDSPTVFSYAFNNLWNTNCPVHQHGDLTFEYHILAFSGAFDAPAAYRAARCASLGPLVFPGDARANTPARAERDGAMIDAIVPSQTGDGWAMRLLARHGKFTTIPLSPDRTSGG